MAKTKTQYDNMEFPDYEFREYPKWVRPEGGDAVLVQSADEEAELMDTGEAPVREEDERARLVLLAGLRDVQIDKRWSIAKITKAIADAGHDASFDPTV